MAEVINTSFSGGMRVTNYSNERLLIFNNNFESGTFTNADAYETTLEIGTVVGRVSATGKIAVFDHSASDGSQYPIGVLASSYTVDGTDSAEVRIVTGGEINGNMLVFPNGETVETAVSSRQVRDWLQLANIVLRYPDELSELDNQ